ncbi:MAG: hypothetical protein AB9880_04110 [Christensenellales bacterium]
MRARIMMLSGDGPSRAMAGAVQEILGDLAAAFGHSFIIKEDRFADDSLRAYGSPLTQETIEACLQVDGILAASRSGEGILSLAGGMGACAGAYVYDIPSCMRGASLLRSETLPRGLLAFPLDAGAACMQATLEAVQTEAGERGWTLRQVPFQGKLKEAWDACMQQKTGGQARTAVVSRSLQELLRELLLGPDSMGAILAQPSACMTLQALATTLCGLASFVYECYWSGHATLYACHVAGDLPDGDSPFGMLYAAADMLRRSFKLSREADCLRASTTNVLDAGWRTHDIAVAGSPRIGTSAICGLIREQISLVGQLMAP